MNTDKEIVLQQLDKRGFYKGFIPSLKDTGKGQTLGLCPFHDDHNPSLSVDLKEGLYNCFSCGAKGDVFKFYQDLKKVDFKTALKEIAAIQGITETQVKQKIVATYEYKDADGKTLYIKERLEPGRNGRNKEFRFKHREGDKWVSGRGSEPVLYNLPELFNAKYALVVEGEGKADLLKKWGLTATCLDSGANSPWKDEYTKLFEGKEKVVILPDNDTPGRSYASKIANALHGKVGSLTVVELPGLEEAADVIDWSRIQGNDKAKLLEIIKEALAWIPIEEPKSHIEFSDEWPEPLPLPEGLPPVKALDSDMIPEPLRKWLMDISDRMQIPPDFSTAAAVVALGSIIGRGCGIYPKRHDDWLVVPNLWGAVIGRPSLMKTPAITEAQRHLVRLETEARDKHQEAANASQIEKEIQKITRDPCCQ